MLATPVKTLLQKIGAYNWLLDRYVDVGGRPGDRGYYGRKYLRGDGLEIGALHYPQSVNRNARVRYVDRLDHTELVKRYPEFEPDSIVKPSIIDNGFELKRVAARSQDFVVANHVLEHSPNPLQTLKNWARLVRVGGYILITVPIAERCFDNGRALTPVEHIYEDYQLCAEGDMDTFRSHNYAHYKEWVAISDATLRRESGKPPFSAQEQEDFINALAEGEAEIHFHTFSIQSFREFLKLFVEQICPDYTLSHISEHGIELIAVLHRAIDTEIH